VICIALSQIVALHSLESDSSSYTVIKSAISEGLKSRMAEKKDVKGVIKRIAWHNNRDFVLATILDPRFKLFFNYLDNNRHDEYKIWLTEEVVQLLQLTISYIHHGVLRLGFLQVVFANI
jgi:hypothetical protein